MATAVSRDSKRIPIGQLALQEAIQPNSPPPASRSFIVNGNRRTVVAENHTEEYYSPQYKTDGSLLGNLRFALKYEPLDLRIIHASLLALGQRAIEAWVRNEPTGGYSRSTWFLYETLTGSKLDLDDARAGNYVDALDSKQSEALGPRQE